MKWDYYLHKMDINGITIRDANGNTIPELSILSGDVGDYNTELAAREGAMQAIERELVYQVKEEVRIRRVVTTYQQMAKSNEDAIDKLKQRYVIEVHKWGDDEYNVLIDRTKQGGDCIVCQEPLNFYAYAEGPFIQRLTRHGQGNLQMLANVLNKAEEDGV